MSCVIQKVSEAGAASQYYDRKTLPSSIAKYTAGSTYKIIIFILSDPDDRAFR